MRWISFGRTVLLALAACWLGSARAQTFTAPSSAQTAAQMRMSPDIVEIVQMSRAGSSEEQILHKIKVLPRMYEVSREDAANLKKLGLPSKYVSAMKSHDKELRKVWKREAVQAAREAGLPVEPDAVYAPKITGGSPLGFGNAPMRKDAPLIWLPPPAFTTNQPSVSPNVRPWTSSTIIEHTPPPPQLERRPASPGPDYVWTSGHWMWLEGAWFWQPGKWWKKPSPESQWMEGDWQRHGRGYIWVPGRWQ